MADTGFTLGLVDRASGWPHYGRAVEALGSEKTMDITAENPEAAGQCDLCVVAGETTAHQVLPLHAARRASVPTLLVMDGILEWRNTWEHPDLRAPLLQPVIADKVACLGPSQARVLSSWGNRGKCEVVGCSRMDPVLGLRGQSALQRDRVLVLSARRPWFTDTQRRQVLRGFSDLRDWFERRHAGGQWMQPPLWRVTEEVAAAMQLPAAEQVPLSADLGECLQRAAAVITSPTTAMLEAMLMDVPVAILDYTNSPHYVPAAWSISCVGHMDDVIPGLLDPDARRIQLQQFLLADALACGTAATPRLVSLMRSMIDIGRRCRQAHQPLKFPDVVLTDTGLPMPAYAGAFGNDVAAEVALVRNELEYWRIHAAGSAPLRERHQRMCRYGYGPLLARLIHTFPYPRRMLQAIRYWREDASA